MKCFADDTLMYIIGDSLPESCNNMNEGLELVSDWLVANKLKSNTFKSMAMLITTSQDKRIKLLQDHPEDRVKFENVLLEFQEVAKETYNSWICVSIIFCLFLPSITFGEDYYELLGINKDADNREIRKAFKKLAVVLHPDKNKDDKDAHDKFVKLARAYETLKDPDLRKRYDLYGEEDGSKSRGKQSYQSWSYYHDSFGIYDDDPEIITLGKAEFEQSVLQGEETWFVNFYSAMCSHCHQMAPTWRRFARRLEGVVRVAAVNCEEDWVLCRNERVQSYPTLVYYPTAERFRGERSEDTLVEFVLERLNVKVEEVRTKNWDISSDEPRVLFFSDLSEDGPNPETRLKLAAMLDGLAKVGHVDCERQSSLCESLGATSGTAVWKAKSKESPPTFLPGLEAQELLSQVLSLLPEPPLLLDQDFVDMQNQLELGQCSPWLLYFHLGEPESSRLDLRRLPAKLPDMRVGRIDCARSANLCATLHIHRYPVYGVFKRHGSYELHHGRSSASDVAQFARESAQSPLVTTLTPQEFSDLGPVTDGPLLVDFFAPWCPPCLRLLPELRRASQQLGSVVTMGTVDCTVHVTLCRQMGVNSYPTTRLYNGSKVEHFSGEHKAESIVDFLQDLISPIVQELTEENFERLVGNKKSDEIWLVDYFAPWCGPCQQLAPQWRKLAKILSDLPMIKIGSVNCESQHSVCSNQGVQSYPSIRLYPTGSTGLSQVALFSGFQRDASSLRQWVMNFVPSAVTALDEDSFDDLVRRNSEPWVVDFYAPWCGHCVHFAPEFEMAARKLSEMGVFSGKVNCEAHRSLCQSEGVRAYPTIRLYSGGRDERHTGVELGSQSAASLVDLVKNLLPPQRGHDEL